MSDDVAENGWDVCWMCVPTCVRCGGDGPVKTPGKPPEQRPTIEEEEHTAEHGHK